MNEGQLFVVSGPSGAGKGSLCKMLLDEVKASLSVSMTTRLPRHDEVDGESYHFITPEEFERVIEAEGFLEYAKVYGNYYGTPKQEVLEKLGEGTDVILEIDVQGAAKIKEKYPDGVFIFILPPSMEELKKRITHRGTETEDKVRLRISEALKEAEHIDMYDYCIVNDNLEEAAARAKAIVIAEHSRVSDGTHVLIEKFKGGM